MAESLELEGREDRGQRREGLDILYLKPGPKDRLTDVKERDLTGELRERYWIQAAQDQGTGPRSFASFEHATTWPIERHELGRNRNEPGDGFRYVFRRGSAGTDGRTEWFEVTEVFEGVEAKDIEAFMRIENGGAAGFEFDPGAFVSGLNMGIPSRASQKRAADKVIDAVERKLNKASYEGMWREHGYGTLIVGLPLWFAMQPANPLRVENVVDDFYTRVPIGLTPYARWLRKKNCPFWRIVVVWNASRESMREWCRKARFEVYDDPACRSMQGMPIPYRALMPFLSKMEDELEDADPDVEGLPYTTQSVYAVRRKKKGKEKLVLLPPAVEEWRRLMEERGRRSREKLLERIKLYAAARFLEVFCFIRVHGMVGFERWLTARVSPRRRIALFVSRRRARRLYRASLRRKSKKGGALAHGGRNVTKPRRQRPAKAMMM